MSKTIFGAGTSGNPIKAQVACEQGYAALPYIIKNEETDNCKTTVTFEHGYYYDYSSFTEGCDCTYTDCGDKTKHKYTSGTFIVDGLEFHYDLDIVKNCNPKPECEGGCTVGDYWITKEDGELFVNYEQFSFSNCNSITKSIKKSGFACSTDSDITVNTDCGDKFTFRYECDDVNPCSASTVVNIRGVTFTPVTVEYSGGNVTITISYEKIITDADCNERKSRGSIILSGSVSACTSNCCYDKSVPLIINKSDILGKLKLPNETPITYNGKEVTGDKVTFYIVQKANPDPNECNKDCTYTITYCVLEDTEHKIKIEYETYWGSKDWTGTAISTAGGRAKISFDYKAFAKPVGNLTFCKPYEYNGKDSVIVEVPPCDGSSTSSAVTLDGAILYKERDNTCINTEHVSGETVTIDGKAVFMNHISYQLLQDCSGACVPGTYTVYGVGTTTAEACDTTATGNVPVSTITVSDDCQTTIIEGSVEMTVQIDKNQDASERTIETDYLEVNQSAGPCMPAEACACSALTIVGAGGEYTDVCDSPVYKYKDIEITCEAHEEVEIPFVGYCDGVAVYNGIYKWKGYFPCNSGTESVVYRRTDNGGEMKVTQLGNCTNCGEIPPSPGGCEGGSQLRYEYATVRLPDCNERLNFKVESEPYSAYCGDDFKSASTSSVTINVSCNDTGSQRTLEYKGVPIIQPGGSCQCQQPSEDCSQGLVEDGTLNSIIDSVVNSGSLLGVHVSKSDTPCTYKYLRDVYANVSAATTDEHSGPNMTELAWIIANAMSELTPYSGIATSYFVNAAAHHPGGSGSRRPEPFGNDGKINKIISDRINGAIEYVKYKSGGKETQSGLTSNARIELHSKNADISATMRSKPTNDDWENEPEYVNLVELIQEGAPLDTFRSVDYNITSGIILDYQANTTDTAKKARLEEAIKDKDSRPHYMVHDIFGLDNTSSNKYLAYYACDNFTRQANGCVKWNKKYARWRPEPHHKLASPNVKFTIPTSGVVYVSNESEFSSERVDYYTFASCCGACGGPGSADCVSADSTTCSNGYDCSKDCEGAQVAGVTDRCPEDGLTSHESYPSGHAMYGFFMYLVYGQALGSRILNDKKERVERYCENRTIVRAHWMSDTIIGKYNASVQIGFINGFQEYFDVLDTPTFPS